MQPGKHAASNKLKKEIVYRSPIGDHVLSRLGRIHHRPTLPLSLSTLSHSHTKALAACAHLLIHTTLALPTLRSSKPSLVPKSSAWASAFCR